MVFFAKFKANKQSSLEVFDGKNKVKVFGEIPESALNKPTVKQDVKDKLTRTGSTPYFVEKIEIELDDGLFVNNKLLSALKDDALVKLTELRSKIEPINFYYEKSTEDFGIYKCF